MGNAEFQQQLSDVAKSTQKGLVFACNGGGTIRGTTNFPNGQASRSLMSAAAAMQDPELQGLEVKHLQGGLNLWFRQGFDGDGTDAEWEDTSGKTPRARASRQSRMPRGCCSWRAAS